MLIGLYLFLTGILYVMGTIFIVEWAWCRAVSGNYQFAIGVLSHIGTFIAFYMLTTIA